MAKVTYHNVTCDPDEDGQLLRQLILELPPASPKAFLLILSGLPASGKSYFASRFAKKHAAVVLEGDNLRKKMFNPPSYSADESTRFYLALYNLKNSLIKDSYAVIMDSTNIYEVLRQNLYDSGLALGVPVAVVYFETDEQETQRRLNKRLIAGNSSSDADWQVYLKLKNQSEEPSAQWLKINSAQESLPKIFKAVEHALFAVRG
ncbi:MAG: ATP-binding protein [Chloroflexi bacterium]|nr:ATP-binding protein [Chloroflexota bacterium]